MALLQENWARCTLSALDTTAQQHVLQYGKLHGNVPVEPGN